MAKKDQNPEKVDSLSNYKQAMSLNAKLFRVLILVVCFGFITVDGGTTYYGALSLANM